MHCNSSLSVQSAKEDLPSDSPVNMLQLKNQHQTNILEIMFLQLDV